MSARDELAAQVAEHGPFPMPVGEPMPVELTEEQIEALAAAGNRAVNDHYHEDLCFCRSWPTSCESNGYFMGTWDTYAFNIGLPAVLGVWESLRNDRHASKIAELRAEVERLNKSESWYHNELTGANLSLYEEELDNARLRLALASAQRGRRELRARVAELEALAPAPIQTCQSCGAGYDYGHPCSMCEFKKRMAAEIAKSSDEDSHEAKVAEYLATPYADDGPRPLSPSASTEHLAVRAANWNSLYPVGTPVTAYPGCRPEDGLGDEGLVTRTRSKAEVLGGHTAVVWVDGHDSCISLTHVDPRPGGTS